ncbi:hypothetical protein [Nocardia sp. Marseille-Q1738]
MDWWTLSALPATNRTAARQRLFTLNVGPMEVLYVERFLESNDIVDYRITMYMSEYAPTGETLRTLDQLENTFPLLHFQRTGLASAGGDGIVVDWFVSDEGAAEQFFGLPLAAAIRRLAELLVTRGVDRTRRITTAPSPPTSSGASAAPEDQYLPDST